MKSNSAAEPDGAGAAAFPSSFAARALVACSLLIILILGTSPASAYDFAGRVKNVSEPNSMWVNVTDPGTSGLQAEVEVLLQKPLSGLSYFKGKELQFEIKGHDILGRPVCIAYMGEIEIHEVYYCYQYPAECRDGRIAPYNPYDYYWPYGRCMNVCPSCHSPYDRCGNYGPRDPPWLPFF